MYLYMSYSPFTCAIDDPPFGLGRFFPLEKGKEARMRCLCSLMEFGFLLNFELQKYCIYCKSEKEVHLIWSRECPKYNAMWRCWECKKTWRTRSESIMKGFKLEDSIFPRIQYELAHTEQVYVSIIFACAHHE